jgi:hypothetical protein
MSEPSSGFKQFFGTPFKHQGMIEIPAALRIGEPFQAVLLYVTRVSLQPGSRRRLFSGFSILLLVGLGKAQLPQPGFYWQGVRQMPPTTAALAKVVKAHELWVESNGAAGARADLSHHNLSNFDLQGTNLWLANLEGADLAGANLTNAVLGFAGQKDQQQSKAPGEFLPSPPRLGEVSTNLKGAILWSTTLAHADLSYADLSNAELWKADLSGADLAGANLTGANLAGARLDGSDLSNTNLDGTLFEPVSVSLIIGPATNLNRITFQTNPDALIRIRRRFQDEGLTKQEREITYALNRRLTQLDPRVERWFRIVAFDLTCQYGMNPGRPLRIIASLWAIFSFLYIALLHKRRWPRVRISRFYGDKEKTREFWMWGPPSRITSKGKRLSVWLRFEQRTVCAMMFFSLVSAFSLGYREFSVGQWLRMLTKREYDLKATGWVRSLVGIQSLVCIYLFALWVLTYFGRPFE